MAKELTPEEEREADRLYAEWRNAANAEAEAEKRFGNGSPEHGRAVGIAGELWSRYKKLRPTDSKNWAR